MKTTIAKYRGQRIDGVHVKISDIIKLNKKEQEILKKYLVDVGGSAGIKRTAKIERELLVIRDTSEVPLDKWDYDVLSKFLEVLNNTEMAKYTKNDFKKTLKHFLKFQYADWNVRFKELKSNGLKQVNPVNKEKISKETLLKPSEFDLLVRGCDKPMFRVYVHLAYKSAGRPDELLKLKFSDIDLKTGRIKMDSSKTGEMRYIYVDDDCIKDIRQYKENEYAYPDVKPSDYVFVSPVKRSVFVSMPTLYSYLKTISKNRLGRTDIYPYLFRHTKLNEMRKVLSPDAYEMFSGHSLETGMKFYSHNDDEDLRDELYSKVFKKKELSLGEKHELQKEIDTLKKQISEIKKSSEDFLKEIKKEHYLQATKKIEELANKIK